MTAKTSTTTRILHQDSRARGLLMLAVGAGFFAGALFAVQAVLISIVVDRVFLRQQQLARVLPLLGLLLLLLFARSTLIWAGDVLAQRSANRIKTGLRRQLTNQLFRLGPAQFSARAEGSGELVNTMVEGVEALDAYVTQYLPARYLAGLVPGFVALLVLLLDPPSTLVLLVGGPMLVLMLAFIGGQAKAITERRFLEMNWMSAHFLDMLHGLPTLKMFGRSQEQAETIEEISTHYGNTTMEVLRTAFQTSLVMEWAATAATALVAVEISLRLMNDAIPFDQALAVLLLTPEFFLPLRQMALKYHAGTAGQAAAERIFGILDVPVAAGRKIDKSQTANRKPQIADQPAGTGTCGPSHNPTRRLQDYKTTALQDHPTTRLQDHKTTALQDHPTTRLQDHPTTRLQDHKTTRLPDYPSTLRFRDVHYAYRAEKNLRPALRGLSLTIPQGKTVALVGPTGAGKTTVANLLLRFVDPDQGQIVVGETPLQAIDRAAWCAQVAWVPQHPHLFHGSVADNIRLADPAASLDRVVAAARNAHAHEFIKALPQGYDTPLGERGARLSGGEQQRIAIARAFVKNAPLLILDEFTAHLDSQTESLIQQALARLMRGRTVVIIAHRLKLASQADQIVVMDQGIAVQAGSHSELIWQVGTYRALVATDPSHRAGQSSQGCSGGQMPGAPWSLPNKGIA